MLPLQPAMSTGVGVYRAKFTATMVAPLRYLRRCYYLPLITGWIDSHTPPAAFARCFAGCGRALPRLILTSATSLLVHPPRAHALGALTSATPAASHLPALLPPPLLPPNLASSTRAWRVHKRAGAQKRRASLRKTSGISRRYRGLLPAGFTFTGRVLFVCFVLDACTGLDEERTFAWRLRRRSGVYRRNAALRRLTLLAVATVVGTA